MENHQQEPLDHRIPPVLQQSAQGGDTDTPGKSPPEVQPGQGDFDRPGGAPLEEIPGGGDIDQPGETPQEMPSQPIESPPPD